jgi:hypothetical protein
MSPWKLDSDKLGLAGRADVRRAIRERDGDQCRYCNAVVTWGGDRKSGLAATYSAVPQSEVDSWRWISDGFVVACQEHEAEVATGGKLAVRPVPADPVYGKRTLEFLRSCAAESAAAATRDAQSHAGQFAPRIRALAENLRQLHSEVLSLKPGNAYQQSSVERDQLADDKTQSLHITVSDSALESGVLRQVGELLDQLSTDGQRDVFISIGHETSPSVGAPSGAGVMTPTVGAEEGGASAPPADAPAAPSAFEKARNGVRNIASSPPLSAAEHDGAAERIGDALAEVRRRDGDQCRYCGCGVSWAVEGVVSSGVYVHLDIYRPLTAENVVVGCRAHSITRGTLLPAPSSPRYGQSTREFLASAGVPASDPDRFDPPRLHSFALTGDPRADGMYMIRCVTCDTPPSRVGPHTFAQYISDH